MVILSPDSLLLRLLAHPAGDILFWRGLGFAAAMALMLLWRRPRTLRTLPRAIGAGGALIGSLFALSTSLFVFSIQHTAVANTLVIVAASPLFAALLGLLLLGERPSPVTLAAILAGLAGVFVTVRGSLESLRIAGDLAALGTALCMALVFTLIRRRRERDMVPAYLLSGLIICLASLPLAEPLSFSGGEWLWLALLVTLVHPLGFLLIMTGPRYLMAAEVSLLMLLETVLGPIWVWLALGEQPPAATLWGGGIILGSLAAHAALRMGVRRGS